MEQAAGQVFYAIAAVWGWLMDHLLYINLILSIVIVFFQRRDPKAVWTWLLALYFIPVFGFLLYLVLCQDYHKNKMFRVKEVEDRLWSSVKAQEEALQKAMDSLQDSQWRDYVPLVLYNLESSGAVLTLDNSVKIFTDGEDKFADLRAELKRAKRFIHIQYYIIKNDEVFQSILPILKMKAREGVEVRVLYDGMGGRFMPGRVWREMREAGIKVGEFFPAILGRLQLHVNYRNHRKIVVIDGRIGYVGGFNIGKEYISHSPKFGYWRDTHLKITGSAVYSLQIRFALDWNYATKENLFKSGVYFGMETEGMAGAQEQKPAVPEQEPEQLKKPAWEQDRREAELPEQPVGEPAQGESEKPEQPAGELAQGEPEQPEQPAWEQDRREAELSEQPVGEPAQGESEKLKQLEKAVGEQPNGESEQLKKAVGEQARRESELPEQPAGELAQGDPEQPDQAAGGLYRELVEQLEEAAEFPERTPAGRKERPDDAVGRNDVMIQIIASGPDARDRQIRNNYLQMFSQARHHIYIQTPYFVPDDAVLSALEFAARSGIDVRLMFPCKPDHPFAYWATYSYVGDLLAAGARCYTYEGGFLHAKGVMVDGLVSCYGTANMDIRSFELNFEVNATIYDQRVTEALEERFYNDLKRCREVTLRDYSQRNLWIRIREQCSRLLSPLL